METGLLLSTSASDDNTTCGVSGSLSSGMGQTTLEQVQSQSPNDIRSSETRPHSACVLEDEFMEENVQPSIIGRDIDTYLIEKQAELHSTSDSDNGDIVTNFEHVQSQSPIYSQLLETLTESSSKLEDKFMEENVLTPHSENPANTRLINTEPSSSPEKGEGFEPQIPTCRLCVPPRTFKHPSGLTNHLKSHDPKARADKVCELCGKAFFWTSNSSAQEKLSSHLKRCTGPYKMKKKPYIRNTPMPTPYQCEGTDCHQVFSSKEMRRTHQNNCDKIIHKCFKCQRIFHLKRSLNLHMNQSLKGFLTYCQ